MFDQLIKRDFVARRGRNNVLLMRSIQRNVFDEKDQEDYSSPLVTLKGQECYLVKYNKSWLGKRERNPSNNNAGRKRVKFSNLEHCLDTHPQLLRFANWREQAVEGSLAYKRLMKKVKTLDIKSIAESCGVIVKSDQPKVLQNEQSRDSGASRDDDDISSQLQQQEANKVAAYDFVNRNHRRNRREFLLKLNKEDQSDNDVLDAASPTIIQRQAQLIGEQFK